MRARTEDMHQTATYWAPTSLVEFGTVRLATPILIQCRWQGRAVSFTNPQGEQRVSRAVVYVDRELEVGGVIALGDHLSTENPRDVDSAQTVAQVGMSPSLDADEVLHKVWI